MDYIESFRNAAPAPQHQTDCRRHRVRPGRHMMPSPYKGGPTRPVRTPRSCRRPSDHLPVGQGEVLDI